jgi:hypothetical protein
VLLGHGDGSFAAPINLDTVYGQLYTPTLADFNSDGKLDLAAAGWNMYGALVFMGNGDGTLQDPLFYENDTAAGSNSLTAADFNADGKIDLATANQDFSETGDNDVSILLGNGDGTFAPALPLDVSLSYSWAVATGDLDADGKLDLAVTSDDGFGTGTVSVLLGHGDGRFADPINLDTFYGQLYSPTLADLNGDGKLDLAAAGWKVPLPLPSATLTLPSPASS